MKPACKRDAIPSCLPWLRVYGGAFQKSCPGQGAADKGRHQGNKGTYQYVQGSRQGTGKGARALAAQPR